MFFLFFIIWLIMMIVPLAAIILTYVASWKVHQKAGLPGWSGIVPFYNYYARAELCESKSLFWKALTITGITIGVYILGGIVVSLMGLMAEVIGYDSASSSMIILVGIGIVWYIACFVLYIFSMIQFVKIDIEFVSHFGKGIGFAVGMYFLPYVFYPILAWGENNNWRDNDCII